MKMDFGSNEFDQERFDNAVRNSFNRAMANLKYMGFISATR